MTDLFKSKETYASAESERPTRTALDSSETDRMAKLPGQKKYPGHDVQNVVRARRGYTTY